MDRVHSLRGCVCLCSIFFPLLETLLHLFWSKKYTSTFYLQFLHNAHYPILCFIWYPAVQLQQSVTFSSGSLLNMSWQNVACEFPRLLSDIILARGWWCTMHSFSPVSVPSGLVGEALTGICQFLNYFRLVFHLKGGEKMALGVVMWEMCSWVSGSFHKEVVHA